MVKVSSIDLTSKDFEGLLSSAYIVMKVDTIEPGDYILFTQNETNRNVMTRVVKTTTNDGFKTGYALVAVTLLG